MNDIEEMKDKTGKRLYSLGRIITLCIFGLCWISLSSHAADISCTNLYAGVRASGEWDSVYVGDRKPIPDPEIVAQLDRLQRANTAKLDAGMDRFLNRAAGTPGVVDRAGARKNWPS